MACNQCTKNGHCLDQHYNNYEEKRIIKRNVKTGIISPDIADDLIEKLAGTILAHCLKFDKKTWRSKRGG